MKTFTALEYLEAYEPGTLALAQDATAVLAEFTARATEVATQVGCEARGGRYPEAVWVIALK